MNSPQPPLDPSNGLPLGWVIIGIFLALPVTVLLGWGLSALHLLPVH